ncbi:K(+)/H(+) antiporter [Marasmius crinis-equi]|uniref:K(+)/H(+) antiporter n=1 Tax=Marasmius crinis-equi TaxID=585013 RepID=A0ABR3FNU2_9AGAR
MLFTGVAYSTTAFPILCRILTKLKLLDTTVGVVVLSAGVAKGIIGWTLLALSVALVNVGTGGTLIVLFPVKYALRWLGKKTGSIEAGHLTMVYMAPIIIFVFTSAFVADIIRVHVIFGAFIVGLAVPRDGGLAIALTEKLEDMVAIILLPWYEDSSIPEVYSSSSFTSTILTFRELRVESGKAFRAVLDDIRGFAKRTKGRRIVVAGRSRRLAVENHGKELKEILHRGEGGDEHLSAWMD